MMTCSKCGNPSAPAPFCSVCGNSLLVGGLMPAMPPPMQPKMSGLAITGFVLSFVCGVLGLIFSLIGYSEVKKSNGKLTGEGFALAGIIISLVSVLCAILIWFMVFKAVGEIADSFEGSTARMDLHRMATSAKQVYYEKSEFPTVDHPPIGSCCSEPNKRCREDWTAPAWKAIDYSDFGPSRYRFGYRSTPTSFEAMAIGDADCDGNEVVYTLRIDAQDGTPTTGLVETSGID
jgi:hypothetical protein